MSAVHVVVNRMEPAEYGVFFTLLRIFLLMGFPAGGLQTVFAQQAAAAISEAEQRRLAATTRAVFRGTFVIWLIMAAATFFWRKEILLMLKIANPAALWVTVALGLASLWTPVIKGLLQGRQDFFGLGWVTIIDGIGRFTAIAFLVQLGGQAAGAMTGALAGQTVALALGGWLTYKVWHGPRDSFQWKPWLKRVIPLTAGVGSILFMTNADVVFVQIAFPEIKTPFYMAAAMIGLALVTFTTPLAAVMFPKVVQSAARTERTDALKQALVATMFLGGLAALACTLFPELPLRIIYFRNAMYWKSAPLVPWFAWCLLPLIFANLLIGNLLARDRFAVVPWLAGVAVTYGLTLFSLKETLAIAETFQAFKLVIQTLGVFSSLLLLVAAYFTWQERKRSMPAIGSSRPPHSEQALNSAPAKSES